MKIENNNDSCYDCNYYDRQTGICMSHEGCIMADDKNIDLL